MLCESVKRFVEIGIKHQGLWSLTPFAQTVRDFISHLDIQGANHIILRQTAFPPCVSLTGSPDDPHNMSQSFKKLFLLQLSHMALLQNTRGWLSPARWALRSPPRILKRIARLATTKDSAASRHRVPRLLYE